MSTFHIILFHLCNLIHQISKYEPIEIWVGAAINDKKNILNKLKTSIILKTYGSKTHGRSETTRIHAPSVYVQKAQSSALMKFVSFMFLSVFYEIS